MLLFPNAKINLGLNVICRRPDGYHDIETLFVPLPEIRDVLEVVFAEKPAMIQYGLEYDGEPEDNLCFKAYRLMAEKYGISPVEIHLYKNIPVGAGLGGGSADAAFTLVALNILFKLGLNNETLASLAAQLGSDCPFFIYNRPMLAQGRGEILEPYEIDLSKYEIKLIPLPVHVSTREAYRGVVPHKTDIPLIEVLSKPVENWKDLLFNDFEPSVFEAYPLIAQTKDRLYEEGAVYASMSGSGSSVFGIFRK